LDLLVRGSSFRVLLLAGALAMAVLVVPPSALAQTPGPCDSPNTCTIWPASQAPAVASVVDANAVELGVKFRASVNGFVTAIRFFKGPSNTGTHVVNLWT